MKKGIAILMIASLMITSTGLSSCQQGSKSNQNTLDTAKLSLTKNVHNQKPYEKYIDSKYEYVDSEGGSIVIQNSLPKGEGYTDPNGKEYFKTIFWTRIINETDNPFELKIDFPGNLYELPSSPDKHFKILLPSDTMILDKVDLANYGQTDLKSFLDNSIYKQSSLKRIIDPKESNGFYVVILFDKGLGGPFRTGLSIKGQKLFYRISRFGSTSTHPLMDWEKEINFGSINLKNLVLQK
jgi:hypothetical protein